MGRGDFQGGEEIDWGSMFARVEGIASARPPKDNDWRYFISNFKEEWEISLIQPYVAGEMFGLSSYLPIPPIVGIVKIQWQQ